MSPENPSENRMDDDEKAIRDLISSWAEATVSKDLPRVLELMDPDVVFLVAGQPPMSGRDAFVRAFEAMPAGLQFQPSFEIQEIQILDDWAYCWSRLEVTIHPPGGSTVRRRGDTLSIYRKGAEGRWLLFRDANLLATVPSEPG